MTTHTKNFDHFVGDVVLDPFEGVDPNRQFNFECAVYVPNDPPGVNFVRNMAHYNGLLLSLHVLTDEMSRVEGSAVMVAPGVAYTAAHVLEPQLREVMEGKKRLMCIGYTSSGPRLWRVGEITKANGTDLMILSLRYASALPEDNRFVQGSITTRLPRLGERVMIAGLRASDQHIPMDDEMNFAVTDGRVPFGADVRIGVGEVTQHFLSGRGSMLPGSVIEVSCSTPGGLSGGPAFDQHGMVVGVLSTSFDHEDGRGPSYVSLLWPALIRPITPYFMPQLFPAKVRLLDSQYCYIDRRDVIQCSTDEETGLDRVEYEADPA